MSMLLDHSLEILLGMGTLLTFVWLCFLQRRLPMKWYVALPIAVCHTLFGVLTVKAFAFLETGFDAQSLGNMSLFGGVFFMPLFYLAVAKLARRPVAEVFDVFVIPLVGTLLFARVNCILSGCCLGNLIGDTGMRWPTREAEIVFYLVFISLVAPRILKGERRGEMYPLYLVGYGAFRFVVEFFRYSSAALGPFHISHLWAFVALGLGASILMEIRSDNEKNGKKGKKVRS